MRSEALRKEKGSSQALPVISGVLQEARAGAAARLEGCRRGGRGRSRRPRPLEAESGFRVASDTGSPVTAARVSFVPAPRIPPCRGLVFFRALLAAALCIGWSLAWGASPAAWGAEECRPWCADPFWIDEIVSTPSGEEVADLHLSQLRGKPIVLSFWGIDCEPCRSLIPVWNERVAKYGDRLHFVAVAERDTPRDAFLADYPLDGWMGIDRDRSLAKEFGLISVPTTLFLRPNGQLLRSMNSPQRDAEFEELVQEVLHPKEPGTRSSPHPVPFLRIEIQAHQNGPDNWYRTRSGFRANGISLERIVREGAVGPEVLVVEFESPLPEGQFDFSVESQGGREATREHVRAGLKQAFGIHVRVTEQERMVYLLQGAGPVGPWLEEGLREYPAAVKPQAGIDVTVNARSSSLAEMVERVIGAPVFDETDLEATYYARLKNFKDEESFSPKDLIQHIREKWGLELVPVRRVIPVAVVTMEHGPGGER